MMGVGTIVATGIFSFLPYIYAKVTGPAVVISLLLSAGTAALSGLCYSEFACEFPVTGGGFFYTMLVCYALRDATPRNALPPRGVR